MAGRSGVKPGYNGPPRPPSMPDPNPQNPPPSYKP